MNSAGEKQHRLKRELNLLDIFCVATGAMISSGLFVLPALAFTKAGPGVIVSYFIAGILCIPTLLSKAELTTAMPKAGGDYFYIMRGFGPLLGTLAGLSSWISLALKGAFALIGMGAYISLMIHVPLKVAACFCCLIFIVLNTIGIKEAVRFQVAVVVALLGILAVYVGWGFSSIRYEYLHPFFSRGASNVLATASFVFVSYGGLTKVAALAEETKNPGRNLPLGMFWSLTITALIYGAVILVTVGVLDPTALSHTLVPITAGARAFSGPLLAGAVSIAAFLAFISTANSGLMTSSRYPLSMSRDQLFPSVFAKIDPILHTPVLAIFVTGAFMLFAVAFLQLEVLVKIASSILILLYLFANLTLILFRESKITSYQPKFHAPGYPYVQIVGILGGFLLLIELGTFIVFATMVFLFGGFLWYKIYAQKRAIQDTALIYALERLIAKDKELVSDTILTELKDIVMERDAVVADAFHSLVEQAKVFDVDFPFRAEAFFRLVAQCACKEVPVPAVELSRRFLEREFNSSTVIRPGLAIPHIVIPGTRTFKMIMVRARAGIIFPDDKLAHIIFVLMGSADERNRHLKTLAAIAQITQSADFDTQWMQAKDIEQLRSLVLLAQRKRG